MLADDAAALLSKMISSSFFFFYFSKYVIFSRVFNVHAAYYTMFSLRFLFHIFTLTLSTRELFCMKTKRTTTTTKKFVQIITKMLCNKTRNKIQKTTTTEAFERFCVFVFGFCYVLNCVLRAFNSFFFSFF